MVHCQPSQHDGSKAGGKPGIWDVVVAESNGELSAGSCLRRQGRRQGRDTMKGVRLVATLLVILACALSAAAQSSDEAAKRRHFLPHIADGGGWKSLVQVTNVSQSASRCTLSLHGLSADRFETSSDIRASGLTASFQLDGNGGYLVWGTRNVSRLAYGYGILDCSTPVVAQVVFISVDRSGMPTGMATVPSSQEGTVFQFPVLTPTATLGMAISNDSNADGYCRLDLEDRQRVNQGEATITVPSKTDLPIMLSDVIAIPNTFREGSLTITCNQTVAMVGLHFELRPDRTIITFTTLPAAVLDTSPQTVDPPGCRRRSASRRSQGVRRHGVRVGSAGRVSRWVRPTGMRTMTRVQ